MDGHAQGGDPLARGNVGIHIVVAPLPLQRVIVGPSQSQDKNVAIARKIVGDKIAVTNPRPLLSAESGCRCFDRIQSERGGVGLCMQRKPVC
jgi:hypothetical protein